jgi:hypothetical protein
MPSASGSVASLARTVCRLLHRRRNNDSLKSAGAAAISFLLLSSGQGDISLAFFPGAQRRGLATRLPTPRMPPAVHHCSDNDLVRQHAKVDAVRESSDDGPPCFAVDSGEGQRVGRDALYPLVDRVGELNA